MKVYFYGQNSGHIDARQVTRYFMPEEVCQSLEEADVYLVLSGVYLTYGYGEKIEGELQEAKKRKLPVLAAAPHGTTYIPVDLRPFAWEHCGLSEKEIREGIRKLTVQEQDCPEA